MALIVQQKRWLAKVVGLVKWSIVKIYDAFLSKHCVLNIRYESVIVSAKLSTPGNFGNTPYVQHGHGHRKKTPN